MITTTIAVPVKVTMRTVCELAEQVHAALAANPAVTLDISHVANADLSFVQLIEAARRQASDHALTLDRPANAVVAALLRRAGFLTAPTPADIDFWFHGALPQ